MAEEAAALKRRVTPPGLPIHAQEIATHQLFQPPFAPAALLQVSDEAAQLETVQMVLERFQPKKGERLDHGARLPQPLRG